MDTLFGKPPKLSRTVASQKPSLPSFDSSLATYLPKMKSGFLEEAIQRVLKLPSVGSKSFLITIGDRRYVFRGQKVLDRPQFRDLDLVQGVFALQQRPMACKFFFNRRC